MRSIIEEKSFNFAVRVVKLYKYLVREKKEVVISKQLLRSGTSIGANVAEAEEAQSKPDFVSKMGIALKETAETIYWLRLLGATGYIRESEARSMLTDCEELKKILSSIIKTSRK
ncbi:MAG: four helix bundle protein [Ruminococcaceae bacterium]|nr:four helix bundle protein [Oscillospiraceae bacterium]